MNEQILSRLERLSNLRASGAITDAEFEQQKSALLATDTPPTISTPSPVLPQQAPPKKMSTGKKWAIGLGVFLGLAFLGKLSESTPPTKEQFVNEEADVARRVDSLAQSRAVSAPNWESFDFDDEMDGKGHYTTVTSTNSLNFDFPYQGGSTASLMIRKKKGNTDIALRISKGQFISDFDDPVVRIKIDNKPTVRYSTSNAADGSSDVLFIDNTKRLIAQLRGSQKMTIEAQFYQEGNQKMEFLTKGFVWQ